MQQAGSTGQVFDVERFSTRDGFGIRTTAFLKGCNLHCDWCHNREGIAPEMQLAYRPERCTGCGACAAVCPSEAQQFQNGVHTLERSRCVRCFRCTQVCFSGALEQVGKTWTVEELVETLATDQPYFQTSGGGVTLSGGEVMCQLDFAIRVLTELKKRGIHTAIETNLAVPWDWYEQILPWTDLIMADVKTMDAAVFAQHIGHGFERVLDNTARLLRQNREVIIRTPVVPGINANPEEIRRIARFLKEAKNLLYYELLSYHPMGCEKAAMLGETIPLYETPQPEQMQLLGNTAAATGLKVWVDGKPLDTH